jgi:cell division septation protein DedD
MMSKNKKDQFQEGQGFLTDELENLYQSPPEQKGSDPDIDEIRMGDPETHRVSEGENVVSKKRFLKTNGILNNIAQKSFLFIIPLALIAGFALFIWPAPFQYAPFKKGERIYIVKTNRLTGSKSYYHEGRWLSAPLPDLPALRIPDPLSIKSPGDEPLQIREKPIQATVNTEKNIIPEQPKIPEAKVEGPAPVEKIKSYTEPKETSEKKERASRKKPYAIQIGAFRNADDMNAFLRKVKASPNPHHSKTKIKNLTWHRVYLGRFANKAEAIKFIQKKKLNLLYPGCFVRKIN